MTAAFQTLAERSLIWEKRCGRGDANQIYLAHVRPQNDPDYTSAPFVPEEHTGDARTANSAGLEGKESGTGGALPPQEPQNPPPSYKETSKKEESDIYVSPSVNPVDTNRQADDEKEFQEILDACELDIFEPEVARVFENAIERLFYSDSFRIGNATLPQSRVRSQLHLLDWIILDSAKDKLRSNLGRQVKNSTAYTMATIFNCIAESASDLLVDPYLNSIGRPPERLAPPGRR